MVRGGIRGGSEENCGRGGRVIVRLTYINREISCRFRCTVRCSDDVYVPLWAVRQWTNSHGRRVWKGFNGELGSDRKIGVVRGK